MTFAHFPQKLFGGPIAHDHTEKLTVAIFWVLSLYQACDNGVTPEAGSDLYSAELSMFLDFLETCGSLDFLHYL